jgi:hypothetical protein
MSSLIEQSGTQVARPLKVLVALIKEDIKKGDEAAERAGVPYYRAAGEKMLEAKGQLAHGEFTSWVERNFGIKDRQARRYMLLVDTTRSVQNGRPPSAMTLTEAIGEQSRSERPRAPVWQEPVKQIMGRVDTETLNLRKAEMTRVDERNAERQLAIQLIDIGFKALATKLHPDKGGSRDAMSRLNRVRDRLKQHA